MKTTNEQRLLLGLAVELEKKMHPGSPLARLPPIAFRLAIFRSRVGRRVVRTCLVALWMASFVASLSFAGKGSTYTLLASVGLLLLPLLSTVGLAEDEPLIYDWLERIVLKRLGRILTAALILGSLLAALLTIYTGTAEGRLGALYQFVGILIFLRAMNEDNLGDSYQRRWLRISVAQHTYRWLVVTLLVAIAATLLVVGSQVDRASASAQLSNPWTVIGLIVTLSAMTLTALSRVMSRQRKCLTLLLAAVDEVQGELQRTPERAGLSKAILALDRCLATGVDTGMHLMATRFESEHMRAVIAACAERITGVPDPRKWELLDRARPFVEPLAPEDARRQLSEHLAATRTWVESRVDVAA